MTLLLEPLAFVPCPDAATVGLPRLLQALAAQRAAFDQLAVQSAQLEEMAQRLTACLSAGGKLLVCGQGGSVPLARYLAGRLAGRTAPGRRPLAVLALSADGAPWAESDGQDLYARQVRGLGRAGDALLALSITHDADSPQTPLLLHQALWAAREQGLSSLGLLGAGSSALEQGCHLSLVMPQASPERQLEALLFLGHVLCELVEAELDLS